MLNVARRDSLSLEETDRSVVGYRWLECRRFELLGAWVASTVELEVKQALVRHSHHHAWHASLWEQHLPHRSAYQAPAAGRPGDGGLAVCVKVLAGADGPKTTVERLAGAYRVVAARAVAAYARHLGRTSEVSDPALARTCRLVLADQLDDWREGEALLQSFLDSDDRIERAAVSQAELEKLALATDRTDSA
ncbi:hypothetical protein BH24ACT1_BH24ACT1_08930 [soil metagenome]